MDLVVVARTRGFVIRGQRTALALNEKCVRSTNEWCHEVQDTQTRRCETWFVTCLDLRSCADSNVSTQICLSNPPADKTKKHRFPISLLTHWQSFNGHVPVVSHVVSKHPKAKIIAQ